MTRLLPLALLGAALSVAAVTDASSASWHRQGSVTTGRGTGTFNGGGSCGGHSCSWGGSATGAYGRTVTRQGSASCANGSCNSSRTVTGPNGASATRSGSFTYAPPN